MTKLTHKQKLEQAAIRRHGSLEAYKKFMSDIGKKGGKSLRKTPSGFAASPERARIAGRKGGMRRWHGKDAGDTA